MRIAVDAAGSRTYVLRKVQDGIGVEFLDEYSLMRKD
jgi:hypothetical protein